MTQPWDPETTVPDIPTVATPDTALQLAGSCTWYGQATRRWWGLITGPDGEWRLVEAIDPDDLARAIRVVQASLEP